MRAELPRACYLTNVGYGADFPPQGRSDNRKEKLCPQNSLRLIVLARRYSMNGNHVFDWRPSRGPLWVAQKCPSDSLGKTKTGSSGFVTNLLKIRVAERRREGCRQRRNRQGVCNCLRKPPADRLTARALIVIGREQTSRRLATNLDFPCQPRQGYNDSGSPANWRSSMVRAYMS